MIRPRLLAAALVAAVAGTGGTALAQSFDCGGDLKADERAICDSGRLSVLDDEMAALYRDIESHAMMGVSGETRDVQRKFLANRHACGPDAACIARLYHRRIAELKRTKEAVGQGAAD
jgi:uncharacterized protein